MPISLRILQRDQYSFILTYILYIVKYLLVILCIMNLIESKLLKLSDTQCNKKYTMYFPVHRVD